MSILYDMRSGTLVKSKLYNNGLLLKDSLVFNPLSLFTGDKQGVWYDPSDKSTLFQDVAGAVPVTKDGDPVALMRDKSGNGNHAVQSVSTSRPVYRTDGELHWLDFDGTDDWLTLPEPLSFRNFYVSATPHGTNDPLWGGPSNVYMAVGTNHIRYRSIEYESHVIKEALPTDKPAVISFSIDNDSMITAVANGTQAEGVFFRTMVPMQYIGRAVASYYKGRIYGFLITEDSTKDSEDVVNTYLNEKSGGVY